MNNNIAHISQAIICPRCHTKSLRKSVCSKFGKEYYCHHCHIYMGLDELVHRWGYDVGDLFIEFPIVPLRQFSQPSTFEPDWDTEQERVDSYQVVTRMFLEIPELDDYTDLMNTYRTALDVGVQ